MWLAGIPGFRKQCFWWWSHLMIFRWKWNRVQSYYQSMSRSPVTGNTFLSVTWNDILSSFLLRLKFTVTVPSEKKISPHQKQLVWHDLLCQFMFSIWSFLANVSGITLHLARVSTFSFVNSKITKVTSFCLVPINIVNDNRPVYESSTSCIQDCTGSLWF